MCWWKPLKAPSFFETWGWSEVGVHAPFLLWIFLCCSFSCPHLTGPHTSPEAGSCCRQWRLSVLAVPVFRNPGAATERWSCDLRRGTQPFFTLVSLSVNRDNEFIQCEHELSYYIENIRNSAWHTGISVIQTIVIFSLLASSREL